MDTSKSTPLHPHRGDPCGVDGKAIPGGRPQAIDSADLEPGACQFSSASIAETLALIAALAVESLVSWLEENSRRCLI